MKKVGVAIIANTTVFRNIWRYKRTLQNLCSPLPNAGAISELMTSEKLEPMDMIKMPVVSDPNPRAARYVSPMWPTNAAFTNWYIGWNIMPSMGHTESLRMVFVDYQKP